MVLRAPWWKTVKAKNNSLGTFLGCFADFFDRNVSQNLDWLQQLFKTMRLPNNG
jgi:hypothetical protein